MYAEGTEVSVEKSKTEIERTLARYGATDFGLMVSRNQARVLFVAHNRKLLFNLPLPSKEDVRVTPKGYRRKGKLDKALEQEVRRRWRCLALAIKSKLEVVASGISEFEEEFMANIVTPDGKTVAEHVLPAIEEAYSSGKAVALLEVL